MSAAEDDTELRDLLVQNLENSGVLNKLKAEMRAAVFLAMEEQDRLEGKPPLINESLNQCLKSRDGRLVVSLIVDFLQVFNLDFSLAVFQPETNTLNGLDSRDLVCRELGLSESDLNRKSPLLLELVKRGRQRDQPPVLPEVRQDSDVSRPQSLIPSEKPSSAPVSKDSDRDVLLGKGDFQQTSSRPNREHLDLDLEGDEDPDPEDGDSFFDDPLPKPQKTYGCLSVLAADSEDERGLSLSELRKGDTSGARGSPGASMSEASRPGGTGGGGGAGAGGGGGGGGVSESSLSRKREKETKNSAPSDRTTSLHLGPDEDVEYDDDFNSHRSDLSRSELSIGEEIEEVSMEGPDPSDQETTQDLSVSQISQSHGADYMEEVP
ncbi:FGFR1 oncogene partner isoform X2 [Mugil cephalus]|uniref:FGFR1 oncogene partner isoform X2 n=1 Tax=Mugil cephalus TaxID=48193 RepID=UPI001FB7F0A6|nr:FGFR1 oncogene partner isoform X2 [Mugil cephalus]